MSYDLKAKKCAPVEDLILKCDYYESIFQNPQMEQNTKNGNLDIYSSRASIGEKVNANYKCTRCK
jgi:hypothetical protein